MSETFLLSAHNLGKWAAAARTAPVPGGSMPYGMQLLGEQRTLTWSDSQKSGRWNSRLPRAAGGAVRRWAPGWQGWAGASYARRRLQGADAVVSVFENVGLGFARLQALWPPARRVPHVMVVCWLAEESRRMNASELRSVRRSIQSVSRIAVFSSNQVPILADTFGVDPSRISVVPFGVDTDHYDAAAINGASGGGGLVAVGSDSRRDYASLFEAVRIADVPITVACAPRNLVGLEVPRQVTIRHDAFDDEYRKLLLSADLVVTPTVAPAYPSGQSVVLEAMATGRATLTSDSPAMREYVTDNIDGFLMPARDPAAMAARIVGLLADEQVRTQVQRMAPVVARTRFGLKQMWDAVGEVIAEATGESSR